MRLLFEKKIIGCNPQIIRGLIKDMMACINLWNDLDDEDQFEFRLILNELISNAILHGNQCLCNKGLTAIINEVSSDTLSICICDEGEGFDCDELFEKLAYPSSLYVERGRGLKIIKALCDDIEFTNCYGGSMVKVDKSIKK